MKGAVWHNLRRPILKRRSKDQLDELDGGTFEGVPAHSCKDNEL